VVTGKRYLSTDTLKSLRAAGIRTHLIDRRALSQVLSVEVEAVRNPGAELGDCKGKEV